jgi:hypothetical protein
MRFRIHRYVAASQYHAHQKFPFAPYFPHEKDDMHCIYA